ncbi:type II secretion system F family protein [Photobacterium damselae]|uniref:Type II/IV secretion system protein TadC associated with Flp pilus assembly n=5 Tax=Photobacterium damselae TaxID=38293 RepID=D0Z551_PHODD|nr:type II secretion system F family protein [Photobacterium damselae]EEZ39085.1 type II/IV secretion system protein TadC associated with Flp pilus assembly [Photobacterium damselae subsp. damselae CIP 102761]KAB1180281.1 type II secretion system F family protein [Photobacterium damselae subsp. damselae]MBF7100769.1 type II secretion system F family protein [Photobacterium damselae]NVO73631.1 type II secretion system F family protein [Photobacterium damselae subsp. damselae]PSB82325.1 type II 
MNESTLIFIAMASIFFGIAIILWMIISKVSKQDIYTDFAIVPSSNVHNKTNSLEELKKYLPSALSADVKEIDKKFYSAGFYDFKYAYLYMPIKYLLVLIGSGSIYWFSKGIFDNPTMMAIICVWVVLCISMPDIVLAQKSKTLRHKISGQLPYLLDLLAMCVQTGMTIESSMSYLSREMKGFDRDLSHLLTRTNDRARIIGLEQALDELYIRVPTNEMRSFVMTIKQSLQYGSSIYNILTTLAADIRDMRMLTLEEKIGKLAAKMSIPLILFILIPIVILIAAPGVLRMLQNA